MTDEERLRAEAAKYVNIIYQNSPRIYLGK